MGASTLPIPFNITNPTAQPKLTLTLIKRQESHSFSGHQQRVHSFYYSVEKDPSSSSFSALRAKLHLRDNILKKAVVTNFDVTGMTSNSPLNIAPENAPLNSILAPQRIDFELACSGDFAPDVRESFLLCSSRPFTFTRVCWLRTPLVKANVVTPGMMVLETMSVVMFLGFRTS
ncbi:hypothetical protein P691DRAFT_765705 [Macrolepiota fuliginosa MF-IS2]|uniref:Uncharacterized protein n=1 Tax=Macrolepiota fuliginosa MF-IS2 TaxID=1400762 RepID=A0A9P5X0F8_9AGAR|nr:hypothetical protein P691DRAFT_765705 [Macrolepiota fuliginosa MF-IS2]